MALEVHWEEAKLPAVEQGRGKTKGVRRGRSWEEALAQQGIASVGKPRTNVCARVCA